MDESNLLQKNNVFVEKYGEDIPIHVAGQSPKVAILTCADSRVPPELIFDAGIGEIFVVRVAGNVAFEPSVIESLEYAVAHLNIDMLLIMGHTKCGAVAAAEGGASSPLMDEIKAGFDGVDNILANLRRQLDELPKRSAVIRDAVESGKLELRGAMYRLETGKVEFL